MRSLKGQRFLLHSALPRVEILFNSVLFYTSLLSVIEFFMLHLNYCFTNLLVGLIVGGIHDP